MAKSKEGIRGKVGNYQAPVDTTGMDPEMKKTMGIYTGTGTQMRIPKRSEAETKRLIKERKAENAELQRRRRERQGR